MLFKFDRNFFNSDGSLTIVYKRKELHIPGCIQIDKNEVTIEIHNDFVAMFHVFLNESLGDSICQSQATTETQKPSEMLRTDES